jgi:hypothetical protein
VGEDRRRLRPRLGKDLVHFGPGRGHELPGFGSGAIGLVAGVDDQLRRLGFGASAVFFCFLPRAGRNLLRRLSRPLKEAPDLLCDPVERVPDCRPRGAADLKFRDHAIDAFDVGVHSLAAVAADGKREGDVADLRGHLNWTRKLTEATALLRCA